MIELISRLAPEMMKKIGTKMPKNYIFRFDTQ